MQHTMYENSDQLEIVETYRPVKDASGKVVGLDGEAVFYDPEALLQPLRAYDHYLRAAPLSDDEHRFTYIRCLTNVRNVNGRPQQLGESDAGFVDYYGRPWAKNWEKYFEQGWDKPDEDELPADISDMLK
jgi:hypothetical protein